MSLLSVIVLCLGINDQAYVNLQNLDARTLEMRNDKLQEDIDPAVQPVSHLLSEVTLQIEQNHVILDIFIVEQTSPPISMQPSIPLSVWALQNKVLYTSFIPLLHAMNTVPHIRCQMQQ